MRKTAIAGLALVAYAASTDAFSMGGARIPFTSTSVARSTCASNRPATWVSQQQRKVALRSAAPGVRMQATIQQTNVAMPALSSTMTEGKIVQWTKSVGDKVSAGDILMVVESDKADMDVESFEDGYLAAILVEDGESAAVGSTVAIIVPNKDDIGKIVVGGAAPAAAAAAAPAAAPAAKPAGGGSALPDCATPVFMPALSSTMTEGKIVQWTKSEGDKISAGDILMVVESDKADMDVEAFEEGYLAKILVEDGDAAPVGSTVALLAKTQADIATVVAAAGSASLASAAAPAAAPAAVPAAASKAAASSGASAPRPSGDRVVASPMAKSLAAERGINLGDVAGTGPEGRITAADVENFKAPAKGAKDAGKPAENKAEGPKLDRTGGGVIPAGTVIASPEAKKLAKKNKVDIAKLVGSGAFGRVTPEDVLAAAGKAPAAPKKALATPTRAIPDLPDGPVKMSGMQTAVANNMMATKVAPDFRVARKIQTDKFDELYAALKPRGVTVSALLSRAVALAIEKHPIVNAHFDDKTKSIVYHKDINIANAVAIEGGLITPVIENCNMKDIMTVSNEWKELVGKAKTGKLAPREFQSGTFAISNLGMFGVSQFGSLLPPGTGSILAIGGATEVVKMKNGQPVAVKEMEVTITCDHRHIYGADAAMFLKTLAEILETDTLTIAL